MEEYRLNKIIASNLRTLRKNTFRKYTDPRSGKIRTRKLTQKQVGESINVTFQQVQKYELGTNNIGSAKLKLLADFFNIEIGAMFEPIKTFNKNVDNESLN